MTIAPVWFGGLGSLSGILRTGRRRRRGILSRGHGMGNHLEVAGTSVDLQDAR